MIMRMIWNRMTWKGENLLMDMMEVDILWTMAISLIGKTGVSNNWMILAILGICKVHRQSRWCIRSSMTKNGLYFRNEWRKRNPMNRMFETFSRVFDQQS